MCHWTPFVWCCSMDIMRVAARGTKKVKKKPSSCQVRKGRDVFVSHWDFSSQGQVFVQSQLWCSHSLVSKCQCSLGSDYPVVFEDATCH